jgi:hypothetical protein
MLRDLRPEKFIEINLLSILVNWDSTNIYRLTIFHLDNFCDHVKKREGGAIGWGWKWKRRKKTENYSTDAGNRFSSAEVERDAWSCFILAVLVPSFL